MTPALARCARLVPISHRKEESILLRHSKTAEARGPMGAEMMPRPGFGLGA